ILQAVGNGAAHILTLDGDGLPLTAVGAIFPHSRMHNGVGICQFTFESQYRSCFNRCCSHTYLPYWGCLKMGFRCIGCRAVSAQVPVAFSVVMPENLFQVADTVR